MHTQSQIREMAQAEGGQQEEGTRAPREKQEEPVGGDGNIQPEIMGREGRQGRDQEQDGEDGDEREDSQGLADPESRTGRSQRT